MRDASHFILRISFYRIGYEFVDYQLWNETFENSSQEGSLFLAVNSVPDKFNLTRGFSQDVARASFIIKVKA